MPISIDRPEAVLFDKDGTILPFAPFWTTWTATFRTALAASDAGATGELDGPTRGNGGLLDWPANTRTASHGASLDVATMATLQERVVALLVAEGSAPDDALRITLDAMVHADVAAGALPVTAHEGFTALVRALVRDGSQTAVVTGDDEERAIRHVAALGLGAEIRVVVGGDRGLPGKPDPSTLLAACAGLGTAPEVCVYIGDSLVDVRAARAAGFGAALVYVPLDAVELPAWSHEADDIVRCFRELEEAWCGHAGRSA